MNNGSYEQACCRMYQRAIEVQQNIADLAKDLKATGQYTDEQIGMEVAFALIHEGYRMKELEVEHGNSETKIREGTGGEIQSKSLDI